jgi:hypothetical protein
VHRRRDLDSLAAGLWPLSDSDAGARMNQTGPHLAAAKLAGLDGFSASAAALRKLVTAPTAKGAVSSGLTPKVPEALTGYCRGCRAVHVGDSVLRSIALAAGLELEPDSAPPVLVPRKRSRWPVESDPKVIHKLIRAYLALLGPAGPAEVAGYLDIRRADLEAQWPSGLVEVTVAGRGAWLPADRIEQLTSPRPAELVRLLSPFDPYLQARDRDLLLPDRTAHKRLWPVLGRPGVVLVDGEIAGIWRARSSGQKLTLAVEPNTSLSASTWSRVEAEAERVGAVRGSGSVAVTRP